MYNICNMYIFGFKDLASCWMFVLYNLETRILYCICFTFYHKQISKKLRYPIDVCTCQGKII